MKGIMCYREITILIGTTEIIQIRSDGAIKSIWIFISKIGRFTLDRTPKWGDGGVFEISFGFKTKLFCLRVAAAQTERERERGSGGGGVRVRCRTFQSDKADPEFTPSRLPPPTSHPAPATRSHRTTILTICE